MPKLLAALATVITVCLIAPAAPASADDYSVGIPTRTVVDAPPSVPPQATIDAVITVTANADGASPTGSLSITVTPRAAERGEDGEGDRSARPRTVAYDGSPVTVTLPGRSPGEYTITAAFTPSAPEIYGPSQGADSYVVAAGKAPSDPDDGATPPGGLPDTGGPHTLWLLLGLVLLGVGGATVRQARRRDGLPA